MFVFTIYSEKKLKKFTPNVREYVVLKLKNISHWKIDWNFRALHNFSPATHRLRIGDYRLILKKESSTYIVLDIGHRKNIYK